ncbi:hypothetical protein [Paracidobacterium acidisoli]|uniref:Accessory factor UbiK family protein n=1 Tax=Paracidobacterium acidisoli TaxID=2303751 RepID=A0A372ITR0_9BACT|nr:hypothetical protein [Paracidobacterium acidisoli]MBT9330747.1 hypothetical protein [Paracidobacterium acidisoli]
MAENVLQTLQTLIQDIIAPGVRELQVRVGALEKQIDTEFSSLKAQNDAEFKAIMAAIGEANAKSQLEMMRQLSALQQRVAVLEATRSHQ